MAVIDTYLTELRRALRGPRRTKADLLAEARDSLADAAEAYQRRGLGREAAERRAVTEFGAVPEIASGYQDELALTQGRRTALLVLALLATQHLGAELAWRPMAASDWRVPTGYGHLAEFVDVVGMIVMAAAALAVYAFGPGVRRLRVGRLLVRVTGFVAFSAYVFFVGASFLLVFGGPLGPVLLNPGGLALYGVGTALPLALVVRSCHRCVTVDPVAAHPA